MRYMSLRIGRSPKLCLNKQEKLNIIKENNERLSCFAFPERQEISKYVLILNLSVSKLPLN